MAGRTAAGWRRSAATALAFGLLTASAGCGTRWTDDQEAAVAAMTAGGGDGTGVGGGTGTGGTGGSAATASGSGSTASGASGATGGTGAGGTGGEGASGATGGEGIGAAAPSTLPCAAASDAPGVTDSTITFGTVQTLSGPVPGLGASNQDALRAYVAHRNATGGVCGRQLVLETADDGADNARNRSIVAELEPKILALIAGVAGGADGATDVIQSTSLPVVGTSISPGIEAAPTYYGLNPAPASLDVVIGKYRFLYEQGVRTAAVVWITAAASPQQAQREIALMQAAGIEVVNQQGLPLSTLSYDSAARAVANSGADYMLFLHADGPSASMAQSIADTGYTGLEFEEYIVAYGSNFPELAGAAAEGASTWLYALPAEDGGVVPEQAAFLEAMATSAPNAAVDTFAAQGWSSFKLLADSLEALPGPITRDALLTQLAGTGLYDAGGLLGPVDVGAHQTQSCQVGMVYTNGAWRRIAPASGFLC